MTSSYLSWTKGIPIAKVVNDRGVDKLLYIFEGDAPHIQSDIISVCDKLIFGKRKDRRVINTNEVNNIVESLDKKDPSILKSEKLKQLYEDCIENYNKKNGKNIFLQSSHFEPYPVIQEGQNERIFVSGASGSGKSTWIANYAVNYMDAYPERPIFLFSRKESDDVLDEIENLQRIVINEEFNQEPLTLEELQDSLCIFDDIDSLKNEDILKEIYKLRNDLLETGRSSNINIIVSSHILFNHNKTKNVINECSSIVIFPRHGTAIHHVTRFLKDNQGYSLDEIKYILSLPSRWVEIRCHYPKFILHETGCFIP